MCTDAFCLIRGEHVSGLRQPEIILQQLKELEAGGVEKRDLFLYVLKYFLMQ